MSGWFALSVSLRQEVGITASGGRFWMVECNIFELDDHCLILRVFVLISLMNGGN